MARLLTAVMIAAVMASPLAAGMRDAQTRLAR